MADAAEDLDQNLEGDEAGGQGTQNADDSNTDTPWYSKDWQTKLAGEDEKALKQLSRFKDPSALWTSYQEANRKISSGDYKMSSLPENATEAEVKAYREMHGIPEAPDKYEVDFGDGPKPLEEDKEFLDKFYQNAHANNMPKAQVEAVTKWFYQDREDQVKALQESDQAYAEQSEDIQRKAWGDDYRLNTGLIKTMLEGMSEEDRDNLLGARMADGSLFKHNPAFLNQMLDWSKQINPAATVIPNITGDPVQSIQEEINKLQKMSGDRSKASEYWYGPNAKKNQARLLELNEALLKIEK